MEEETVEVEGVVFPKVFERSRPMQEHVNCVRNMVMRDDDVVLCAYSKAGTHWLWEVGTMLLSGKAQYEKRTKEHVMMESVDVEDMDRLPSPRLLNTHLPPRMLPNAIKDSKKVKVIHVYRNPKDVVVSLWFHIRHELPDLSLSQACSMFLSEKCVGGHYFSFLREMDAFISDNPDLPIFNVSFEQMKANPVDVVKRLAQFLQVPASDDLCNAVAEACSFRKLKEADKDKELPQHFAQFSSAKNMYRKGEVGDWKNHLTVAQNEQMDSVIQAEEGYRNFCFQYTP